LLGGTTELTDGDDVEDGSDSEDCEDGAVWLREAWLREP
jgi:hypothetical protein